MSDETLKALRQRSGMSVRAVAQELGYETHSKYAYYESSRFKGPLPLALAHKLARMWEYLGVNPADVLALAGLGREQADKEYAVSNVLTFQSTIPMTVLFPDDKTLAVMFSVMFEVCEIEDREHEIALALASLLPTALRLAPTWKDLSDREGTYVDQMRKELRRARARMLDGLAWP